MELKSNNAIDETDDLTLNKQSSAALNTFSNNFGITAESISIKLQDSCQASKELHLAFL